MKGRNILTVIRALLDDLKPQRHSSRVLYVFGGFWIFSALVHTGLLAATGFEWSGSVSWRKPIVFGLSIGLLLTVQARRGEASHFNVFEETNATIFALGRTSSE